MWPSRFKPSSMAKTCTTAGVSLRGSFRRRQDSGEICEELVGVFLGDAINEASSKLGDLASHIVLDVIDHPGAVPCILEADLRPALGPAGNPALSLAVDGLSVRWVEIGEGH